MPGVSRSTALAENLIQDGARLLQTVPLRFDWRTYGAVTAVKNQANCGSCWAFAATAFLESEGIRRKKFTRSTLLSDQYLYWCTNSGRYRCNGGDPFVATNYGIARGMPLQKTYPYRIGHAYSNICTSPIIASSAKFGTSGRSAWYWSSITKSSDANITTYLLERPLLLGVDASNWYLYRPDLTAPAINQIWYCPEANSGSTINHAVLLVGYTEEYWIVKNSWGPSWGIWGYILITRDRTRNCGIGHYWGTLTTRLPRVV